MSGSLKSIVYAKGSKSEALLPHLVTDDGEAYRVQRVGVHAFEDDELKKLIGHRIKCKGLVRGKSIIVKEIDDLGAFD